MEDNDADELRKNVSVTEGRQQYSGACVLVTDFRTGFSDIADGAWMLRNKKEQVG